MQHTDRMPGGEGREHLAADVCDAVGREGTLLRE
jgi:hypothetical protein